MRSSAGMNVMATANAARTPKLAKIPKLRRGISGVSANETKPAKVVSAARDTGFKSFPVRLNTKARCSGAVKVLPCISSL